MIDKKHIEDMRVSREAMLAGVAPDISRNFHAVLEKKLLYEHETLAKMADEDAQAELLKAAEKKVLNTHYFVEKKLHLNLI